VFLAFAVVLLADQCHGLYYKTRAYYGASAPSKLQKPYTEMAKVVILLPTMTEECDVSSCRRVVRSMQKNDMENRNMPDLAEKSVKSSS
jgi:hypothetical protein